MGIARTELFEMLERLYARYDDRRYVHPDPLEFLYRYDQADDREVVAILASTLAYGRVRQILRSVDNLLGRLTEHPALFIRDASGEKLHKVCEGFCHRFHSAPDMSALLLGMKQILRKHGSLHRCFMAGHSGRHETVFPALRAFAGEISVVGGARTRLLLGDPARKGACKRWHLLLRWMVRKDKVDLGTWSAVHPRQLIVPLDTHMHRLSRILGLTARKGASLATAMEVTSGFASICPDDPVRYDFCLTRLGIRQDKDVDWLDEFQRLAAQGSAPEGAMSRSRRRSKG